jgi:hypothetical protein
MASTPATMLKIVTQGLQDQERLNPSLGNPSTRFYTTVHRRRTRWASRWERVDFDNLADFGRTATATLPQKGELISRVTLVVVLPDLKGPQDRAEAAAIAAGHTVIGPHWSWTNTVGHAVASNISLLIDGQTIDTLDSRLLEVLSEQETAVEHFESSCDMVARNPSSYTDRAYLGTTRYQRQPNQPVEVVLPFWFSRGPGPQALPIQALSRNKVQITCQFRDVQDLVYTDARVDSRNPGKEAIQAGPLPLLAGATFYETDVAAAPQRIYNQTRTPITQSGTPTLAPFGKVLAGHAMPTRWHFEDAFFVVEYVSLEDREAAAFRMADLQIPITQHIALPPRPTDGAAVIRMPIQQGGLVRDLTLVAQREEATDYNAYFLFSRDLGTPEAEAAGGAQIPWWPDARIPNWDYGDGYVRPAFELRRSDPIQGMALNTRGVARFDHDGPSLFRSLIPALGCRRTPLVDRYIYRYDFGFWPTGGLAETASLPVDEVRGAANWDRLPQKELVVRMTNSRCAAAATAWETDPSQAPVTITDDAFLRLEDHFAPTTAGFRVTLQGATPGGVDGSGAFVTGIVDYQALRRLGGYMTTRLRTNAGGSAALVTQTGADQHLWVAVAGAGGKGSGPTTLRGGDAGNAVQIGTVGGSTTVRQHPAVDAAHGGAGGGRLSDAGVGFPGGSQMLTTSAFVLSHTQTGGTAGGNRDGGDGYYGGGYGSDAGGGGGSYVSRWITEVETDILDVESPVTATVTPLRLIRQAAPRFILYSWLTTYNILRITGGRGALMFSA